MCWWAAWPASVCPRSMSGAVCPPPGQCVCVFPGRVWLPSRVVAHRGPLLPPQPKPSFEQSKKETQRAAAPTAPTEGPPGRQEQEAEKQAALNKGTVLALQVLLQQAPQACPGHGEISAQRSPSLPQHLTWLGSCPPVPGDAQPGVSLSCSGHRAPPNQVSAGGGGGARGQHAEEERRRHGQRAGIQGTALGEGLGAGWAVPGWLWGLFCSRGAALLPGAMGRGWGEQSLRGSAPQQPAGNLPGSAGASLCPRGGQPLAEGCSTGGWGWSPLHAGVFDHGAGLSSPGEAKECRVCQRDEGEDERGGADRPHEAPPERLHEGEAAQPAAAGQPAA